MFADGAPVDPAGVLVVAMSEVVLRHPDLEEIASPPPGGSVTRIAPVEPCRKRRDEKVCEA